MSDSISFDMRTVTPHVFRIHAGVGESGDLPGGLSRYGVLPELPNAAKEPSKHADSVSTDYGCLTATDTGVELSDAKGATRLVQSATRVEPGDAGFSVTFKLQPGEKLYGLGDVTRDRLNKRGYATQVWVRNVASYVPIPIILSTAGWAIFLETTWRHFVDLDSRETGELTIWARGGGLTYFIGIADGIRDLLDVMTEVVGRPTMLPIWAYGLTFVCHQQVDARAMLDNCRQFRDRDIPCDVIGLEPGWMSRRYDYTVDKEWHPDRFEVPYWSPTGPHTFLGAASRLGFKLSLWLCCDYDLSEVEERQLAGPEKADITESTTQDLIGTEDFGHHPVRLDNLTRPGEAWFDHLKPFVDQGAAAFKLDGANQVNEHPDRGWANGMADEEMHNLYPALLNKQMSRGFEEHTGKRAMIYSSGGYAGIQRYSATWAGDTGGGTGPLVSMLNHGLSGHSNTSCDMDVFTKQGIHFGFLMAWSQACSWAYWKHPWYLGEELESIFRDYAKLRYRLLPYIYSAAHVAHRTGTPIMRAMQLQFPDDPGCEERLSQYMLGDALLVGTFEPSVYLPECDGGWIDFWTGEVYPGGSEIKPQVPDDRGGPLFVRSGSIIPMWPAMQYVGQRKIESVELHVYAGASGETILFEDDGESLEYREGAVAETRITLGDNSTVVTIGPRVGSYSGISDSRGFAVVVHTAGQEDGFSPIEVSPAIGDSVDVPFGEGDR